MKNMSIAKLALASLLLLGVPAFAAEPGPIDKALANTERTDADRERDTREKPAEVLAFAGVQPGMTVVDMFSGGGYYAELLAGIVGPTGKVIAVNNVPYAQYAREDVKKRYPEGRLPNVERRLVEASWMDLPPKSADLAIIVMSYHDVYWLDRLHRLAQARAEARRQAADRRSQRAEGHWQGRRGKMAPPQRGLREAEPDVARLRVRKVV
jgi:predicted methyltransferase